MRILTMGVLATSLFIFSGCVPSLKPQYNDVTKQLKIDKYEIENVKLATNKKRGFDVDTMGAVGGKFNIYESDNICKFIVSSEVELKAGYYFTNSAKEDLMNRYKNDCEIENVNELDFYRCVKSYSDSYSGDEIERKYNYNYFIAQSFGTQYGEGYERKYTLGMNKECFEDMYKFFAKEKMQSEKTFKSKFF